MKVSRAFAIPLFTLATASLSFGATFVLEDSIVGDDFYHHFDWHDKPDPTHGRVNYVDQSTSRSENLTYASHDTFVLRTDFKTVLDPNGLGRNSVRIKSKKTYEKHVVIFDIRHMPQGCGTWPAIWENGVLPWPQGGEIDILEGINDQGPNLATLHTTEGCTMPERREQSGMSGQLDCNYQVNSNTGCGVKFPGQVTYGPPFNVNGGGWLALERSETHINVWFWPRNDFFVPPEVRKARPDVNPENWGIPTANFPNTQCDFSTYFSRQNIIINLTLCGDWAGNAYAQSGCPSTCVDFVNNNPGSFAEAYFDFASIRIYT
ncbi:glycoside hydrolase family 16 protein [Crassisporium funariophilum]|nr:glycoside hydrolase family 16 protein [Crassisporium funariophilum]